MIESRSAYFFVLFGVFSSVIDTLITGDGVIWAMVVSPLLDFTRHWYEVLLEFFRQ
jgi:hypothetical protein